ncbi:hypothetical protein JHD48_00310 [Sulfurimonas sp. SAG-AH-194-I05]|nr:hypothetical protein [Sulfurimonas sp. SAG-AH-194-I05]MDF1874168.1 hypothetical protein [Sulfurimonas sp. SAG-AH-194-I05]
MKKILLSAAVAAMALTTTASALEDIKVNGQAKVWYETNNGGATGLFDKKNATGELTFKLGMTGKKGNVGFGATIVQTGTLGLTTNLVNGARSGAANTSTTTPAGVVDGDMFVSEMYITAPLGAKTLLKLGKQELQTPLAFTEKWASVNNTFDAAVVINNSISNVTLVAAYVGQSNGAALNLNNGFTGSYLNPTGTAGGAGATYMLAFHYKGGVAVNGFAYSIQNVAKAYWIDASTKLAGAKVKGYAVHMATETVGADNTNAFALSAGMKAGSVNLFAAASTVSDSNAVAASLAVGNTATGSKKTKLPTMGYYLDGLAVSQPGSTALKLKASGKAAGMGLALQGIRDDNSNTNLTQNELNFIVTKKLGDFNVKTVLMHRDFENTPSQQHVRVIASVNF